jgi:hypothetical protein
MEEMIQKDENGKNFVQMIPKSPIQPYGVFPLLRWLAQKVLEKY